VTVAAGGERAARGRAGRDRDPVPGRPTAPPDPSSGGRGLVNPYRSGPAGDVRGATLGRLGLAAGVIAVVVPPVDGAAGPDVEVWIGSGPTVAQELAQRGPTAGYLWPAPPPDEPLAPSPALDL
jgi:hypothetical protein